MVVVVCCVLCVVCCVLCVVVVCCVLCVVVVVVEWLIIPRRRNIVGGTDLSEVFFRQFSW